MERVMSTVAGYNSSNAFKISPCSQRIISSAPNFRLIMLHLRFHDDLYFISAEFRNGVFEVTSAGAQPFEPDIPSCALTLTDEFSLHVPVVYHDLKRYWLDLNLVDRGVSATPQYVFEVADFGEI